MFSPLSCLVAKFTSMNKNTFTSNVCLQLFHQWALRSIQRGGTRQCCSTCGGPLLHFVLVNIFSCYESCSLQHTLCKNLIGFVLTKKKTSGPIDYYLFHITYSQSSSWSLAGIEVKQHPSTSEYQSVFTRCFRKKYVVPLCTEQEVFPRKH